MRQFKHIRMENWRNFGNVNVELQGRVVLVGLNASGKSNFLDVFRFLYDLVSIGGGFQEAVRKRDGISKLRYLGARQYSDITIEVTISSDDEAPVWKYRLQFKQDRQKRPIIKQERVIRGGETILRRPDEAVLRRLVSSVNASLKTIYITNGKPKLLKNLQGYNKAAHFAHWVILIDLDHDANCPVDFKKAHLPQIAPYLCFRVAVREIEAWLLADRERIASFLSVSLKDVPTTPESLDRPARALVDLAQKSRRRVIREEMVPRPGSGREVGAAYASRLIEFIRDEEAGWRPDVAALSAESLSRCIQCLKRLVLEQPVR